MSNRIILTENCESVLIVKAARITPLGVPGGCLVAWKGLHKERYGGAYATGYATV